LHLVLASLLVVTLHPSAMLHCPPHPGSGRGKFQRWTLKPVSMFFNHAPNDTRASPEPLLYDPPSPSPSPRLPLIIEVPSSPFASEGEEGTAITRPSSEAGAVAESAATGMTRAMKQPPPLEESLLPAACPLIPRSRPRRSGPTGARFATAPPGISPSPLARSEGNGRLPPSSEGNWRLPPSGLG
jgi:hypothetical protein